MFIQWILELLIVILFHITHRLTLSGVRLYSRGEKYIYFFFRPLAQVRYWGGAKDSIFAQCIIVPWPPTNACDISYQYRQINILAWILIPNCWIFTFSHFATVDLGRHREFERLLIKYIHGSDYVFVPVRTLPPAQSPRPQFAAIKQEWSDCHEIKSNHIDWTLSITCDHRNWLLPWSWHLIFKIKYLICKVLWQDYPIATRWKINVSILTLGLKCSHHLWPWSWPWLRISEVKFLNSCISGMSGPIGAKRKRNNLIGCWSNNVNLTFDNMGGLHPGFLRLNYIWIAIFREWRGLLTLN